MYPYTSNHLPSDKPNSTNTKHTPTPMQFPSRKNSLFLLLSLVAVLFAAVGIIPLARAAENKLVAIIVPSPENPFFKALADAALL